MTRTVMRVPQAEPAVQVLLQEQELQQQVLLQELVQVQEQVQEQVQVQQPRLQEHWHRLQERRCSTS